MKALGTAEDIRRREMATIHVAKKELQLDEDAYRDLMLTVTGKTSSAQLDWQGRKKLLDHFKKLGFRVKGSKNDRPAPKVGGDRQAQMGKIGALLADAGRPWAYADGVAKRLFASSTKVERIEFCDGAHLAKVIAAMSIDATRRSERTAPAKPSTQESDHGT
jgi:phage gp16-like protein